MQLDQLSIAVTAPRNPRRDANLIPRPQQRTNLRNAMRLVNNAALYRAIRVSLEIIL